MSDLDAIDARIVRELRRDGRIANLRLAERVGLSPSATLRRVDALERRGVIRGYRAVLDAGKVGRGHVVYVMVGLSDHSKAAQRAFEAAMARTPEVVECHSTAGTFDYLLRVETPDLPAYKVFHDDVLGTVPTVRSITSVIVMESPKDERA
ncbi:Lrp/AsnC family transcriptional regulator [Rubellimicrobium aerolatum]|uniref:Lrp/AsnC family transcriptional regulator n=1 Tax=Rubellimicrobium aerolatum TaxID=490979 RepID=A0ABW0S6W3_9RHOB|nr:Lrp/AsnC family transcriptional regulator [Rubellimicrobium aerolatum]MBP1804628.1 DNA-binding Lrp family transcriptional regulator [Rubellimicrobium aerolatum]